MLKSLRHAALPALALLALALALAPAPAARGQVYGGAPLTHENVLATTPVWSRADPFALSYLASRTNDIDSVAALGPRVTALEGGTNNWNTAYSWGDHAGLYRAIGWVPSWGDLTDIPQDFPPSTHEHDYTAVTNPPWLTEYIETDEIALAALYGTNAILRAEITNEAALRAAHTNDTENPHQVTPAQIGAATTGELAAVEAALAGYQSAAYWPPNATASSWFTFTTNSGAITITGYNIAGGTAVIIPDYINGWPVTEIGENAFEERVVTSIGGAGNVVTVGDGAFGFCGWLTSVSLPQVQTVRDNAFSGCGGLTSVPLPQVQTVGNSAFSGCGGLTSVSLPQVQTVGNYAFSLCGGLTSLYFDGNAPTIGAEIFADIPANQVTNYVTNPTATGWGDELGGMPVVRLPLYGDKIYQAGELVATTGHVAQAIAAIPEPDLSDHPTFSQIAASNALPYTAWTGTITPSDGTATVAIAHGNMPVLVIDAPTVLQLDATGFGTSGVSRVSLSYYTGTNALTFATDVISYAETPTVDTNGWNTLLLRRVSNSDWKGVGL